MSDDFEDIRVVGRKKAAELANISADTWDRMEKRDQTPPRTKISERRIGYRVADLRAWLDGRREKQGAASS